MAIPALQAFIGQVGPNTVGDGNTPAIRLGRTAEAIMQELHGRYYETTYRGFMYSAAVGAATTTAALNTTPCTGLILSNPAGSSVNLVLNKVGFGTTVVWPAVAVVGLMQGYSAAAWTNTTKGTIYNNKFNGQSASQANVYTNATLPVAPLLTTIFGGGLTGAATTTPGDFNVFDMEGSILVQPGGFVSFYTSTVSPTTGFSGMYTWEEVPI